MPPENPRDVASVHVDYLSLGAIGFDAWLLEKPVDAKAFQPEHRRVRHFFARIQREHAGKRPAAFPMRSPFPRKGRIHQGGGSKEPFDARWIV